MNRSFRGVGVGVVGVLLSVGIAGCSSSGTDSTSRFGTTINQVQAGTPRSVVQRDLGKPDERRSGVVGVQAVGPQPPATLKAGSRYEQWIYRRNGTEYHVFMGPSIKDPGHWEVVSVSANPESTRALEH